MAKAWPRPCPSAAQVPCALNLAFPLRPLGFNGGGEDSDSLDTSGEYALAQPAKPRFERPFEIGTVLVDNGAAEASTLQPETAEGPGTDVLGAEPSGSEWPGDSHLAAMLNSALVRPLLCLWLASRRHPYTFRQRHPADQSSSEQFDQCGGLTVPLAGQSHAIRFGHKIEGNGANCRARRTTFLD